MQSNSAPNLFSSMLKNILKHSLISALSVAFFVAGAHAVSAATITVNTFTDTVANDGQCSLREAIGAANGNSAIVNGVQSNCVAGSGVSDTINLPGTNAIFPTNYNISTSGLGQLTISSSISIVGQKPASVPPFFIGTFPTIDANNLSRVFSVQAAGGNLTLQDLTLQNGHVGSIVNIPLNGGAISNLGILKLNSNVTIKNSTANGNGGAIYNNGSLVAVSNSNLDNNHADADNNSDGNGGAIYNATNGIITNIDTNTIIQNNSAVYGGAIYNQAISPAKGAIAAISGGTIIQNNTATIDGGAIYNQGTIAAINGATISGNKADSDNNQTGSGGGVFNIATGTITNLISSTLDNNQGMQGGNIYNAGQLSTISASTITNGKANQDGGGLYNTGSITNISNGNFNHNNANADSNANGDGGAIYNGATGVITTIDGSSQLSTNGAIFGGGLFNLGTVSLTSVTVNSNDTHDGAGIWNGGVISALNSVTINNNTALAPGKLGDGGGIYNGQTGMIISIAGGQMKSNKAWNDGGAIFNAGTIQNINSAIRILSNNADHFGGAIKNMGTLNTLGSATIQSNNALSDGGGLYNSGTVNLIAGTDFDQNNANNGGAIFNDVNGNTGGAMIGAINANTTITANNAAVNGGGIYNNGTIPTISSISITGNKANKDGGGVYNNSGAGITAITNTTIDNNTADQDNMNGGDGGGVWNGGTMGMTGGSINDNIATYGGGLRNSGTFTTDAVDINDNNAISGGGGIYNASITNLTNGTLVSGNTSSIGAGIWNMNNNAILTITNSNINGNIASSLGGGVANVGTFIAQNGSNINGNNAQDGGGIYNYTFATATISNSSLTSNQANGGNGGGIYNDSNNNGNGTVNLDGSTLDANTASNNGGGIFNLGDLNSSNATAIKNGNASSGGGVYNDGTIHFNSTSVTSNTSTANGAGIYNHNGTIVAISGGSISNNLADGEGGGIYNDVSANITNIIGVAFTLNIADANLSGSDNGGGIYNTGFIDAIDTVNMNANKASNNGGGIYNNGLINNILNSDVKSGTADNDHNNAGEGGGIYNDDQGLIHTISGGLFDNNNAYNGGFLSNRGTIDLIDNANISNNKADRFGGGVDNSGTITTLSNTSFQGNKGDFNNLGSGDGGAIRNNGALTNVNNVTFSTNSASRGGAIANSNIINNLNNSNFSDNTSKTHGGAIYNPGTISVLNTSTFTDNLADSDSNSSGDGGAVYVTSLNNLPITNTTFTGNQANNGGAIYNDGSATTYVQNSQFSNNIALANGGGIYNAGIFNIYNSTANNNQAVDGGGLYNTSNSLLQNSTFSGNQATDDGGAIYNDKTIQLISVTIAQNKANTDGSGLGVGAGVYTDNSSNSASVSSNNTIMVDNISDLLGQLTPDDFRTNGTSALTSNGHNLIASSNDPGWLASELLNGNSSLVDPVLQDNGGGTLTHALLVGSPAINTGLPADCPVVDQRGMARVQTCDIGAFEYQTIVNLQTPTVTVTSSVNPATVGQNIDFTATVTGVNGQPTPTGSLNLIIGNTSIPLQLDINGVAVFSSAVNQGSHNVVGDYLGDALYQPAQSVAFTQVVNLQTPTVTVTSSVNPATVGQNIDFTATVTGVNGQPTPTGSLNLIIGNASIPLQLDINGVAVFSSAILQGSHNVVGDYLGDAIYQPAQSVAFTQVVDPIQGGGGGNLQTSTAVLTSNLNPSNFGDNVTFTATVTGVNGQPTPTGTVNFMEGITTLGNGTLDASGVTTFSTSTLSVGTHTLTAVYLGDAVYAGSSSNSLDQVVNAQQGGGGSDVTPPTLTEVTPVTGVPGGVGLTNDNTPDYTFKSNEDATVTIYGGSCASTAGLTLTANTDTTTTLTFNNPPTYSALPDGTYSDCTITAVDGSGNVSAPLQISTFTVDTTAPILTEVTPVPTPTTDTTPDYTFNTTESGDLVQNGGCNMLGGIYPTGDNTITFQNLNPGLYSNCELTITDAAGNVSNSLAISPFTIDQPQNPLLISTTSLDLALGFSNPSIVGNTVDFIATVVDPNDAQAVPTGTVKLYDGDPANGGVEIDSQTLNNGAVTFSINSLTQGNHALYAAYLGDATYDLSGAQLSHDVDPIQGGGGGNLQTSTISLSSNLNPSTFGDNVTFTANVTGINGQPMPTGTVNFMEGITTLGNGTLDAAGVTTFSTSTLSVGTHTLTAVYLGDAVYAGSSSNSVTQDVNQVNGGGQNQAPTLSNVPVSLGAINENDQANLSFNVSDPEGDNMNITVQWGDGSSDSLNSLSGLITLPSHTYADDGLPSNPADASEDYTITIDVDDLHGNAVNGTTSITVNNLNPNLTATANPNQVVGGSGNLVVISGTVSDIGTLDTETVDINFGENPGWITAPLNNGSFAVGYGYAAVSQSTVYSATVKATDDDGGVTTQTVFVTVDPVQGGNLTATTTTLALAPGFNTPSIVGNTVDFIATVADPNNAQNTVIGGVNLYDGDPAQGGTLVSTKLLNNGFVTFSVNSLTVGNHNLFAVYQGNINFSTSFGQLNHDVDPIQGGGGGNLQTSTTVLTSNLNPSNFGDNVTFTANVTGINGQPMPTGTVNFMEGITTLGNGTLDASGVTTFSTSTLSVGTHTLTAVYLGDAVYAGNSSSSIDQVVNPVQNPPVCADITATGLLPIPSTAAQGETIGVPAFTTTNQGNANSGSFNNGIYLSDDQNINNADVVLYTNNNPNLNPNISFYNNPGTVTIPANTTPGTYWVGLLVDNANAVTECDENNNVISAQITITAANPGGGNLQTSTTVLTSNLNPSNFGDNVTFTANVTGINGQPTPTGTVNFMEGITTLGNGTLDAAGVTTFSTTTLSVGTHTLTAVYLGDAVYTGSSSSSLDQVVNAQQGGGGNAPTLDLNANSASQNEGNSGTTDFTFTVARSGDTSGTTTVDYAVTGSGANAADMTDFGGALPTGTVTFQAGDTTQPITIHVSGDTTVESDENFTVTLSNTVNGTINTAAADGTIINDDSNNGGGGNLQTSTTVLTSNLNPSNFGDNVTFTATVTGINGQPTPTGTVNFMEGITTLGNGTLDASGVTTFSTSTLSVGTHTLTAIYLGDAVYAGSSSSSIDQVVNSVQPPVCADLIPTGLLPVMPTTVAQGGSVQLSDWILNNQGSGASNDLSNGFYLSTDATLTNADVYLTANSNTTLAAGASFNWSGPSLIIPANTVPGTYFIGVLVDYGNGTAECDETNNFISAQITVTASNPPVQDTTGPVVTVITPVPVLGNNPTPSYTFSLDEDGMITSFSGACSTSLALPGANVAANQAKTITLNYNDPVNNFPPFPDGTWSNCLLIFKDLFGNQTIHHVAAFTIDQTAPTLAEVTPVPTPSTNTTPSYTFSSDEAGTITYGGACSSSTTTVTVAGNTTITLNALNPGTYNDCTITVTDNVGNVSTPLAISPFTIDTVVVVPPVGGGNGGGGGGGQPTPGIVVNGNPGGGAGGQPAAGGGGNVDGQGNPAGGGGNVDPQGNPIVPFTDTETHWAKDDIAALQSECGVDGFKDENGKLLNLFKPEMEIDRYSLITIVVKCKFGNQPAPTQKPFPDVEMDHWAAGYVYKAKTSGIVEGFIDGKFWGSQKVTRAEALKMVSLVWFTLEDIKAVPATTACKDLVAGRWDTKYFNFALENDIMNGYTFIGGAAAGVCGPTDNMTRGQAAKVIIKTMNMAKKVEAAKAATKQVADKPKLIPLES